MPQQELFFDYQVGDRRVEVLKTYDQAFAHEAFGNMDESAQDALWKTLDIEGNFEPDDIPARDDSEAPDFLWEAMLESAREDGSLLSFFVVNEAQSGRRESLYVSPDWPSAEAYAKRRIGAVSS